MKAEKRLRGQRPDGKMSDRSRLVVNSIDGRERRGASHRTFGKGRFRMMLVGLVRTMRHRHAHRMSLRWRGHPKRHEHYGDQREESDKSVHRFSLPAHLDSAL